MLDNNKTGGPAFPQDIVDRWGTRTCEGGMTLRDYFAAKAMQSFLNNVGCKSDQQWFDEIAVGAYRQADAMLRAREANND